MEPMPSQILSSNGADDIELAIKTAVNLKEEHHEDERTHTGDIEAHSVVLCLTK